MESWVDSAVFKTFSSLCEGLYYFLVTSILYCCRYDGITIIYIHDVYVFVSSAWYGGEASAYIWVNISFLNYTRFQSCTKHYICFSIVFQVCIWRFLFGWFSTIYLSSHLQVFNCCVTWFLKMIIDKLFCETWTILQGTLFDCLAEACCC